MDKVEDSGYRSFDFAFSYTRPELSLKLEGELQIRTTLQHAWAEVSHDTFYKNEHLKHLPSVISEGGGALMHVISDILSSADQSFVHLRKLVR